MDSYYIIVGLGNPGNKYDGTRHNVGFKVIDELADRYKIDRPVHFGKSMIGKGVIGGQKVILVKPLTYMNLSGEAVREICSFYKVDHHDHLLVISDDVDLPVGHLRIRKKGSAGGHNGLKNIIQHMGDDEFTRIRIGVGGKPAPGADLANHVLGHFAGEDKAKNNTLSEPAACFTLDECLIACHRDCMKELAFDDTVCDGWHLYGADLCLQAGLKPDLKVMVIPMDYVWHKSNGNADKSYRDTQDKLAKKYKGKYKIINTTNGFQYTGAFKRTLMNIYRKIRYRF